MTAALQKHSPLYLQVRDRLIKRIEEGRVDPSGKLPSEHEICREFQVSRTTARLAVEELIEQGLVVRLPGKGSYVRDRQPASEGPVLRTVGVITEIDVELHPSRATGCLMVIQGIRAAIEPLGGQIILMSAERQQKGAMPNVEWDGLILVSPPVSLQRRFKNATVPTVLIGSRHESVTLPSVALHTFQMAFEAVEYLVNLGHSRIAVLAGDLKNVGRRKLIQGYEAAFLKHTLSWSEEWKVEVGEEEEDIEPRVARLIDDGVTAFMVTGEFRISQVWDVLTGYGLQVPQDVSLFILEQDLSKLKWRPRYSGMYHDHAGLGRKAFELLSRVAKGEDMDGQVYIEIPVLREGETVGKCRGGMKK